MLDTWVPLKARGACLFLPVLALTLFSFCTGLGSDDEHRLVKYLFDQQGYNPLIRPVANLSDKLTIKFGLTMIQLINVVSFFSYLSIYTSNF